MLLRRIQTVSSWNNQILDTARRMKLETNLTWGQIAEILEIDHDVQTTGDAIRKAIARRNETSDITIPPPIAYPLAPMLNIDYRNVLILYDIHAGYHHTEFITQMVKLARIAKIDTVVTDADIFDFDSLSRYTKTSKQTELNDDLEIAGKMLYWLGNYFRIFMIDANHGARMKKKLNQPLDLQRIVSMALNGRNANVTATNREYMGMDDFVFAHPSEMSSTIIGKVPAQLVQKYGKNVLTGHTHKRGHTYVGSKIALEVGCCINGENVAYKQETVNAYGGFMLGAALIIDGEIFHFDDKGNTHLNGNLKKDFKFWERRFK